MSEKISEENSENWLLFYMAAGVMFAALIAIYFYVPTEKTEGIVQRIMYIHIPSAWIAFFAFFIVFVSSILYLWKNEREWDIYAQASAEIGVVFCSLVLITGPLWAKPIWGTWWVWDARLTSTLVLWLIYVAYLMLRAQTEPGSMRAKYSAVVGIVGFLDIPLIHFSVLWWENMHPKPKIITSEGVGTGMATSMFATLMISLAAFTLLYFLLMGQRVRLEKMRDEIDFIKKEKLYSN